MKLKILNILKNNVKSLRWHTTDIFVYNKRQKVDDGHLDEMYNVPKTPAVITLDSSDIKPMSLLNI